MTDIVERLRDPSKGSPRWQDTMLEAADEIERLRKEVASLRLTLGGKTFGPDVPEPVGCPLPGACAQVAEIKRLRNAEAAARREGIEAAHNACERRLRFHLVDDYQNRDSELRAEGVRGCQGIIGDLLALSRLGGQR